MEVKEFYVKALGKTSSVRVIVQHKPEREHEFEREERVEMPNYTPSRKVKKMIRTVLLMDDDDIDNFIKLNETKNMTKRQDV